MKCIFLFPAVLLALCVTPVHAGILFEDLDPGPGSVISGGLTITSVPFDASRLAVGDVDVSTGTGPFMNISPGVNFDVSGLVGKDFSAFAEVYVPTATTMDTLGDSIYLQLDFTNAATPLAGGNFVRFTSGFFNPTNLANNNNFDTWLQMAIDNVVPATTPVGGSAGAQPVDTASIALIFADGGFTFGDASDNNNSAAGTFALADNFRFSVVPEPTTGLLVVAACAGLLARRSRQ